MKVFDIMSDHIVTVGLREPVSAAAARAAWTALSSTAAR